MNEFYVKNLDWHWTTKKESGNFTPSFVSESCCHIDEFGDVAGQEQLIKDTAAIMYAAGSDTVRVPKSERHIIESNTILDIFPDCLVHSCSSEISWCTQEGARSNWFCYTIWRPSYVRWPGTPAVRHCHLYGGNEMERCITNRYAICSLRATTFLIWLFRRISTCPHARRRLQRVQTTEGGYHNCKFLVRM